MRAVDVRGAVDRFLNGEGRTVTPLALADATANVVALTHPDLGLLASLRGALGSFWVSGRGRVVQYAGPPLPGPAPAPGRPPPSAYERGIAFAQRHVDDFSSRRFVARPPANEGGRLVLSWTEQAREGQEVAVFPNWVEVVLDPASAQLLRCSLSDLRLVRHDPPAIGPAQVRAWVKARYGAQSAVEDLSLQLMPRAGTDPADLSPPAITVWNVGLMFLGPQGPVNDRVLIDADSGAQLND